MLLFPMARDSQTSVGSEAASWPGYRRVIEVVPSADCVTALLEDDFHCMAVSLRHAGGFVQKVDAFADRMPWTTCPGAVAKLVATFEGSALDEVTARRDKKSNCTHLHDLAVLAAAHADNDAELRFEFSASDPRDGVRILEGRREGQLLHRWVEREGVIAEPQVIKGETLFTLRDWIGSLAGPVQETARLLQWASIVAHGRTIPPEQQREASDLPANCYTFQPERAVRAQRTGVSFDFSEGSRVPLEGLRARMIAAGSETSFADRHETPV